MHHTATSRTAITLCPLLLLLALTHPAHAQETGQPWATIRYTGVVNACIYLIDGTFVERRQSREDEGRPTLTRVLQLPWTMIRLISQGIWRLFVPEGESYRVPPGSHTVRIGYWTSQTRWVTRDFVLSVKAGQTATIATAISVPGSPCPEAAIAYIRHQNTAVCFNVSYSPAGVP